MFGSYVVFFLFILFVLLSEGFGIDPRIISRDGNLEIQTESHKNISFKTDGECAVQIHGVDFVTAESTIKLVDSTMDKYDTILKSTSQKVLSLIWFLVMKRDCVMQRIRKLDASTKDLSHTSVNRNLMETLREELSNLKSSVSNLNKMLTKNDCQSSPCKNGGTCRDLFNGVFCNCANGWEGANCEKDINECVRFNSTDLGCQNGGVCVNKPGTYECVCVNGWYGLHCTRKTADCNSGSVAEICGHGACIPQNNALGYKCLCDQGWKKGTEGEACVQDVDECKEENPRCSKDPLVSCENTPGSFRCGPCPTGYTGNGFYCADINECDLFNGGCSMNPKVECENTPGSRICGTCPPGYIGNGITCTFQGICKTNNGNCHPSATCHDFPSISSTYVECRCPKGYIGNGIGAMGCIALTSSRCNPNPCVNGKCILNTNSLEGYTCQCSGTYYGKNCDLTDGACASSPCQNGGTCMNHNVSYSCHCPPEYIGFNCDIIREVYFSECGGSMKGMEEGNITYPLGFMSGLEADQDCSWQIKTEPNKILNITFHSFDVGEGECTSNWLEILDEGSGSLGKFCGKKLPNGGSVLTSTNDVSINLRQNGQSGSFQLEWKSVISKCYNILNLTATNSSGYIRYSSENVTNRDCFWYIQAPLDKVIALTFYQFSMGNTSDCSNYVKISSSFTEGQDILANYCGIEVATPLTSSGPEVNIHIHTESQNRNLIVYIGYSLRNGCGTVFNGKSGIISSPHRSSSEFTCFYEIQQFYQLKTNISFISLSLQDSAGCTEEYIAIYDGRNTSSPLIGRYCGNVAPADFIASGGSILIKLKGKSGTASFKLKYEAVCGGVFEAESGFIQSEGYPNSYPPNSKCLYLIKQPPGTIITLQIQDMELEYGDDYYEDCFFDYLEVHDGDNENATLLGNYCSGSEVEAIVSSSNYLLLKFVTDISETGKGFKVKYTTSHSGCGGILTNRTGFISYESGVLTRRQCKWTLQAPPGFIVRISWSTFEVESSYSCSTNYVNVYENSSNSKDSVLIGSYCGSRLPPVILTMSNIATISTVFRNSNRKQQEFSALYAFLNQTNVCGGNYFTTTGYIKSPGYPKSYPPHTDCTWTIRVPSGQQIRLNTSVFQVGEFSCVHDYIEIRNGGSAYSPLIGRFCKSNVPKIITSHTNQLYLRVHCVLVSPRSKFLLEWTATTTGCGGTLTTPTGLISSPNYPEPYTRLTECFWRIVVNQGSVMQLVFLDLDLEGSVLRSHCYLDFVEIFDGPSKSSKSLGKFCSSYPTFLMSTKNEVDVHFKSDISYEGRGFNLQYRTVCSNNLTGYGGVIESPNFPETYSTYQDCYWNITVAKKNRINITFSHFDLREIRLRSYLDSAPDGNYLEIKYVAIDDMTDDINYVELAKYRNNTIPTSISIPSDRAILHFKSDSHLIGNGFRLEWIIDGCGGHLRKPGNITSPNYPNKYPDGVECVWLLEAPIGYSIAISFTFVDVEREGSCVYDGIKVFNGPDDTYPRLGLICHLDKPILYTGNGHLMTVQFVSDNSYSGKGFASNFTFIRSKCGGKMTSPSGTITSPNYPRNFNAGDRCEWLITTDENHVIDFEFEDIDLTTSPKCLSNYVQVYDGPTTANGLLGQVCGNTVLNKTYSSTTNQMLVVFKTSGYFTSLGFKANYYKACGARIQAEETSGYLRLHPLALAAMERYDNCTWTIIAPNSDQHISLTITQMQKASDEFQLEPYVSVYDGESANSHKIGDYHPPMIPPTIVSNGKSLHVVVLRSVDFFATYNIFGSNCGGTLTGLSGMFSSPDYPRSYPSDTACEWTIQLAPGNEVSISFQKFNIPVSDKCNMDFLEIRQKNATGNVIGVYCGDKKPTKITYQGSIWIYFKTSKTDNDTTVSTTGNGFLAEYTMATHVELKGYRGEIASPLYPASFSSLEEFSWKITANFKGARIRLEFKDLYIESFLDDKCYTSYVIIYDGPDKQAPSLGSFCGLAKPKPIESSSDSLYIEAITNSRRLDNKFLLKWNLIYYYKRPTVKEDCGSNEIIDISKIHQYNLTSPNYPGEHEPRMICTWTFQTDSTKSLRINFTDLDLQNHYSSYCFYELINIFSGKVSVKTVCHKKEMNIFYNTSNVMKIVFHSQKNTSKFAAIISERCGGSMGESFGIIDFNENSPRDDKCEWKISVRAGRTVEIKFLEYSFSNDDGCNNFILMKNGYSSTSPDLGNGKYCDKPPTLTTTSNNLFIKFHGNPLTNKFKASYREISYDCGGSISISEDMPYTLITSPNYPNTSEPFIECVWVVRSPPGTYIQLDFEDRFDFHRSPKCSTEAIELRDGGTQRSPLINTFCGDVPSTQFSSDNMMFVKFFTEEKVPGIGFQANISIASCGGTYKGKTGEINWHKDLKIHNNQMCYWHIIAPSYATLTLQITLQDKKGISCGLYVYEISKTPPYNETLLARMCEGEISKKITSFSNHVIVKYSNQVNIFKSTPSISITYNISEEGCVFTKNADFGTIQSPGYPNLNYLSTICSWVIKVPEGRRITVNITDFDLGRYTSSKEMSQSLSFYDFGDHLIDELYYNSTNRLIKSSGNRMYVLFICTKSSNQRGFSAYYSSNEETVCNDNFNDARGRITRNKNEIQYSCLYKNTQESPLNKTLALTVYSSLVYKTNRLNRSYIQIEVDPVEDMFGETIYSTNQPTSDPVIIRTASLTTIVGVSIKGMDSNFTIDYEYFPCGGNIKGETGTINTPNYPNKYNKQLECAWVLKLPDEHQIKLNFVSINLGDDCEKSFIIIYNGEYPTSPRIGKFCNNNLPGSITAQKNHLFVEYHHEENSTGIGFNATYEPVIKGCGGTFTNRYRVIETPNYPKNYPNNAECRWEIVAPEGSHIELNYVNRFQLEDTSGCKNDYVEISDWKDEKWQSLGKWCGRYVRTTKSSSNRMLIIFRSNDKITGTGFQATWQMKCGGVFQTSRDKKYIISPGYPFHYENNLQCRYSIYSRESFVIEFEDFALEADYPTCINDNITINTYPSHSYSYRRGNLYCGAVKPPKIYSRVYAIIIFKSDSWLTDRGFKFSFKINECGEAITSPRQLVNTLTSNPSQIPYIPSYQRPSPFRSNGIYSLPYVQNCLWNITAPKDRSIVLKFSSFSTRYSSSCYTNALDVYDGPKMNNQFLLAKLCGQLDNQLPILTSTNNTALLYLRRSNLVNQPTFTVDIIFAPGPAEGCGGSVFLNQSKIIKAPKNLFNVDCQWTFIVAENFKIEYTFTKLNLSEKCGEVRKHGAKNCTCSFIEIRDGSGPFSELMDQLCSKSTNFTQKLVTSWKYGFLRFYSNGNSTDAFEISVNPIPEICGAHELFATNEVKTITSPGFPKPYESNIKCLWTIKKQSYNQNLALRFVEFDLTNHTGHVTENVCSGDRLEIDELDRSKMYKGRGNQISSKDQSMLIHFSDYGGVVQYCGKESKPFDTFSQASSINVGFISTSEPMKGKGFKIEYFLTGCDYNYTADYGKIILRTNRTQCSIFITSSENTTISLYLHTFWLHLQNNCSFGSLEVFDGHSRTSSKLLQYCGYATPSPIFASSNKILISLTNSRPFIYSYSRIEANFVASTQGKGCGGKIFGKSGTITSPMYPSPYKNDTICIWEINIPIGAQVAITISRFELGLSCDVNYLKITTYRKGKSNDRTFCKQDNPSRIYSDNKVIITYKSSVNNVGKGWLLTFKTVSPNFVENRPAPPLIHPSSHFPLIPGYTHHRLG
ncbi:hypothetical protein HHI36_023157 [Cryptolaemus montrouzieri]|uniref:Cubilin n=1 Tax=Cryptolaemus montrouzieri TaxID=559131 RepID=A0ABD2PFM3_9CUCU